MTDESCKKFVADTGGPVYKGIVQAGQALLIPAGWIVGFGVDTEMVAGIRKAFIPGGTQANLQEVAQQLSAVHALTGWGVLKILVEKWKEE